MNRKAVLCLVIIPLVAMVVAAVLLTAIFGPSDNGLRCSRTQQESTCEIRQSRFFDLAGNSSFVIPESSIPGAKAFCPVARVGGHTGVSCNVYLSLDSGEDYLVVSYGLRSQAENTAKRLNNCFQDKSSQSIDIQEDILTPILLRGILTVLVVLVILGWRWRRPRAAGIASDLKMTVGRS